MKFATHHISDELSTIFYTLGYILIAAVIIAARSTEWHLSKKAWSLGILVGLLMASATLTLFIAYRWGKASVVTPLVALYPLVTVVLAGLFLKEHFDLIKIAAIALALMAGLALSMEGKCGSRFRRRSNRDPPTFAAPGPRDGELYLRKEGGSQ